MTAQTTADPATAATTLSLKERITAFAATIAARFPTELLKTLGGELHKLAESGIAGRALAVGAKAPDFTLPDAHGAKVNLAALLEKGPVVVTFYRGGWCPFCDLQLRAYQAVLPEIHALGAELVAISPQTPDHVLSDAEKKALTFPVLSDAANGVARQYGLVFAISEALKQVHAHTGSILPKFNGDDSWELPMPGTFVLDRGGVVCLAHVDTDYRVRLEPKAITDALTAIRR